MNIAITSLYLPSGSKIGVGYQVHALANELVKRGHHVTVYSQSGASDDSLYEIIVVPSGKRLRTFGFAWNLRHYDFSQYDVLHACGDDWFLWRSKRPFHVHTFMGSLLSEFKHAKTFSGKLRMGAMALCEYTSCFLADELVAISQNTCDDLPRIKKVIPCGVNLKAFVPCVEKSSVPAILFVGTLHGRKRGAMLLDIFNREIKPRIPNAEFWAVCDNVPEGKGVRCFGRISEDTLTDLYRRAWVFCLPSTYEGFGVPYIEAMASGTPVVATPNVGAREVTQEGQSGLIVKSAALAETLVHVLTDSALRDQLRTAGLARAQDFGWDQICIQYEMIYAASKLIPHNMIVT